MDKQKLVLVVFMVFVLVAVLAGAMLGQKQASLYSASKAAFDGTLTTPAAGSVGRSGKGYLQQAVTQYGKFLVSGQITEVGTDSVTVDGYSGGEALARRGANGGSVVDRATGRANRLTGSGSTGTASQNKPATHKYTVMISADTVIDTDQNLKSDLKGAIRQGMQSGNFDPSQITLPTSGSLTLSDLKAGMRVKIYATAEVPAADATITASIVSVGNGDPFTAFSNMPNFPADAFGNFGGGNNGTPFPTISIVIPPISIEPQN